MLTEQPVLITSINCLETAGLTKNHFVKFTGYGGAEGTKSLGVCNADTAFDEMMPVVCKGIALVEAAEAIGVGIGVKAYDNGTAAICDVSTKLEGYAMDASISAGQLIRILLV